MVFLLAETAMQEIETGDLEEARRMIGDATLLVEQVRSEVVRTEALRLLGQALLALGCALLALGDPGGRAAIEDAGTAFEDLDDQAAMRQVDSLLRNVQGMIEATPWSITCRVRS